jgi:hypothetical protein
MNSELTAEQFSTAIQELAKLRLQIDTDKGNGSNQSSVSMNIVLEKKFKEIFATLSADPNLNMSPLQLKEQIKSEIARLQNENILIEKAEKEHRDSHVLFNWRASEEVLEAQAARALKIRESYDAEKIKVSFFKNLTSNSWKLKSVQINKNQPLKTREIILKKMNQSTLQPYVHVELRDHLGRILGENFSPIDFQGQYLLALQQAFAEAWSTGKFFDVGKITISFTDNKNLPMEQEIIDAGLDVKRYVEVLEFPAVDVVVSKIYTIAQGKDSVMIPASVTAMGGGYKTQRNDFHNEQLEDPKFQAYGEFGKVMKFHEKLAIQGLEKNRVPYYERLYLDLLKAHNITLENLSGIEE